MSIKEKVKYGNGIYHESYENITELEVGKFDYIKGVYKIDNTTKIETKKIVELSRYRVQYNSVDLIIVAVKQEDWIFFYNDSCERWKLLQEIAKGGSGCKSIFNKAEQDGGVLKIIWKELLRLACEEHLIANPYIYASELGISQDFVFYGTLGKSYFYEGSDFEEFYNSLLKLCQENIEEARKEIYLLCKERIEQQYGKNFENLPQVLENYATTIVFDEIAGHAEKVEEEVEFWKQAYDKRIVSETWMQNYIHVLKEKKKVLETYYCNHNNSMLIAEHGTIRERKIELLDTLRGLSFEDALEMYRLYQAWCRTLENELTQAIFNSEMSLLHCYKEYYYLGSVLISDYLNKINKNKAKRRMILQSDIDRALLYFYETDNVESARQLREKEEYLDNKKNGLLGEREVEYALKWLNGSYISIPKTSMTKFGEKAIILGNPDFNNETQEYDHLVVGKQGVFLIETKNYAGKLIVDKNGNWIRIRNDGSEEGERNPIQQLRRHEKLLRSIVGKDITIISLICMAHPKMIIEGVENCAAPIIKSDLLTDFIENYVSAQELTETEIKQCVEAIAKHML